MTRILDTLSNSQPELQNWKGTGYSRLDKTQLCQHSKDSAHMGTRSNLAHETCSQDGMHPHAKRSEIPNQVPVSKPNYVQRTLCASQTVAKICQRIEMEVQT